MRRLAIKQRNLPIILLLTGILCIVGILILPTKSQTTYIENLKVRSEDQSILVSWSIPSVRLGNSIEVEMQSPNGTFTYELCPWESSYKYTQGEHGVFYDICVKVKDSAGKVIEEQNAQSLFVDWDVFSDIPILSIDTYSGNDPTATYLRNPGELADGKGVLGATIIDNEPVFANIKMMKRGDEIYSSTAEISLRGNTSAFSEKNHTN